jgi:Xaa-Pro aminopeptidase
MKTPSPLKSNNNPLYLNRLKTLKEILNSNGVNGAIISNRSNIFYLSGTHQTHPVNREALLFISQEHTVLYHSAFITPPPLSYIESQPMANPSTYGQIIHRLFDNASTIGIEESNLTVSEFNRFKSELPKKHFDAIDALLANMRLIKDISEQQMIAKAIEITSKSLKFALNHVSSKSTITEIELAHTLESFMIRAGASGTAFPTIVAFDNHSASPHHTPTTRTLKKNSVVLIDCGAIYKGYASDATRTVCLGTPNPEYLHIKSAVDQAYAQAIKLISPLPNQLNASELDNLVRNSIITQGYGEYFIHTTGHGLGIDIHEPPSISKSNPTILQPGMIITVEPGIYLPGKFGYRHENTIILS